MSGVSKTAIGDIAIGVKTSLTKEQKEGFCKAFGCKATELYEDDDFHDNRP